MQHVPVPQRNRCARCRTTDGHARLRWRLCAKPLSAAQQSSKKLDASHTLLRFVWSVAIGAWAAPQAHIGLVGFQYFRPFPTAGNIWIHLIPLLVIVGGIATSWLPVWPGRPWEFFQNIAPIAVCYAGSVTYHTMMAHHEKYQTWITLDVSADLRAHQARIAAC